MNQEKAIAKLSLRAVRVGRCLVLPRQGSQRYFTIVVDLKHTSAHRLFFRHYHGPIPAGLEVCHSCDNGYCIAKEHLFLGTHQENMADRNRKGRATGRQRKVSSDQVLEIRKQIAGGKSKQELAQQFGCCVGTIDRYLKMEAI